MMQQQTSRDGKWPAPVRFLILVAGLVPCAVLWYWVAGLVLAAII